MGWNINFSGENKLVEIKYFGIVSKKDLEEAFSGAVEHWKEHNTFLILSDCSEMKGGHTLSDLFGIISEMENVDILRNVKEAVIISKNSEPAENIEFWETACRNRGFNVKIFKEKCEAEKWLLS